MRLDPVVYERVIYRCCELKAKVVVEDERETKGLRAVLNYGHTFGHAIERISNYALMNHGEGVSIGMGMAADLALLLNPDCETLKELKSRQDALLKAIGLPVAVSGLDPQAIAEAMKTDKKYRKGRNRLILPTRIGNVELVRDVDEALILKAIEGRCEVGE